jgi:hypothetical protein
MVPAPIKKSPLLLLLVLDAFVAALAFSLGSPPRTVSAEGATLHLPNAVGGNGIASVTFNWTPVPGPSKTLAGRPSRKLRREAGVAGGM